MDQSFRIEWITSRDDIKTLADFFSRQLRLDSSYISHGEIQCGRSQDDKEWSDKLEAVIQQEFESIPGNRNKSLAVALDTKNAPTGLAIVRWVKDETTCFAILEDIIVDQALRQHGIGEELFSFIEHEALHKGCKRIFLESGLNNSGAHKFIEKQGFKKISYSFMKAF